MKNLSEVVEALVKGNASTTDNKPYGVPIKNINQIQEGDYIYDLFDKYRNRRYMCIVGKNAIYKRSDGSGMSLDIKIGLNAADKIKIDCDFGAPDKSDITRYCTKKECEELNKLAKENNIKI